MTVKTTTEETETAQCPRLEPGTIFEGYFAIHESSRPEALPQDSLPISPATTHLAEKKVQTAKGTTKGSGKKKKDIRQHWQLWFISGMCWMVTSNGVSRILSALKRFWPIVLLILMMLPHQVTACELDRDCTLWHGERNDATLDVKDVKAFLWEGGLFNVSSMRYNKICPDAFAYAPVERIILSFNNVSSLPVNLFRGISNLEKVELQGNPLTEVPSVLNSTKTVRCLNLAYTKIGDIPKYSINGMSGLLVLNLSRTEITDVPEDIFDMSLRLVHLSQTKLDRLPLPPPTSAAEFNVTLVGTHGTELSISYPDSGKRKIGINITGIETLTCENAKTVVESSYCVLAGEIECDHGSFRKINILLKGKTGFPPSCTRKDNVNTNSTLTAKVVSDVSSNTPVPNWGAVTPSSNSCKHSVSLHLFIGSLVIGFIIGTLFGV